MQEAIGNKQQAMANNLEKLFMSVEVRLNSENKVYCYWQCPGFPGAQQTQKTTTGTKNFLRVLRASLVPVVLQNYQTVMQPVCA